MRQVKTVALVALLTLILNSCCSDNVTLYDPTKDGNGGGGGTINNPNDPCFGKVLPEYVEVK